MPNSNTAEAAKRNSSPQYIVLRDCNGRYLNLSVSNNWWTSLVPAPAVIPAPIAYINAVAVKKLVVGSRAQVERRPNRNLLAYC